MKDIENIFMTTKYFYERMRSSDAAMKKVASNDAMQDSTLLKKPSDNFKYDLQAFIVFARAIMHVMKTTFDDVIEELNSKGKKDKANKVSEWMKARKEEIDKDLIIQFFINRRNLILKEAVNPVIFSVEIKLESFPTGNLNIKVLDNEGTVKETREPNSNKIINDNPTTRMTPPKLDWHFSPTNTNIKEILITQNDAMVSCGQFLKKIELITSEAKTFLECL